MLLWKSSVQGFDWKRICTAYLQSKVSIFSHCDKNRATIFTFLQTNKPVLFESADSKSVNPCNIISFRHSPRTMCHPFNVPKYEELSVEKLWAFVQEWPELVEYFPDLDQGKLPERFFIMGALWTLRGEEMKELIKNERENRSVVNKNRLWSISLNGN